MGDEEETGLFDAAEFGVFANGKVSVNNVTGMVTCEVDLPHGVKQLLIAPMPVICAWAFDNPSEVLAKHAGELVF
jgi:hypothetical protein